MLAFSIERIWAINLNHPASRVTSTDDAKVTAVASDGPLVSVAFIDEAGAPSIKALKLAELVRHLAISSPGELLAVVSASHRLQLLQLAINGFGNQLSRSEDRVHETCEFASSSTNLVVSVHSNGKASNRQDTLICWSTTLLAA